MKKLNWSTKGFKALDPAELYRILRLREEVFMLEQECLYRDLDDKDQACIHIMGSDAKNGALAAYARIVPPGLTFAEPAISRVVTAGGYRGLQLGKELVRYTIRAAQDTYPNVSIRISAQAHLQRFYKEFGFVPQGEIYLEDGIDHIAMILQTATETPYLDIHTHRQNASAFAIYNLGENELEKRSTTPPMVSAGIHPWDVRPDKLTGRLHRIATLATLPEVALIGECGLDKLKGPPLEEQQPAFVEQVRIAVQHQKPVIIHCVKAYDELIAIQREYRFDTPLIIHGFNKSTQLAKQLTGQGFLLSFGSAVLKNDQLAGTLSFLHTKRIPFFLETDDSPVSIEEIYKRTAILLKISIDELKDVIFAAWKKIGLKHG